MKILILVLFASVLATPIKHPEWEEFKARYGKSYATPEEENMRMGIFMKQLERVRDANVIEQKRINGFLEARSAINGFADMTYEEYRMKYHLDRGFALKNLTTLKGGDFYKYKGKTVPDSVDHREKGNVLPIRSQGGCGSCWAFSAAASLEGLQAVQTGNAVVLSVSNILECSGEGDNCDSGGDPIAGFNYASTIKGLDAESCYPYTYENIERQDEPYKSCQESENCKVTIKFGSPDFYAFADGDPNYALAMKEVTSAQPISVAVNWNRELGEYDGKSIFYADATACDPKALSHAINVIGYGTSSDGDYWIVKNSHGTGWGDKGFGQIARGFNVCGIESHSSFPNGGLV